MLRLPTNSNLASQKTLTKVGLSFLLLLSGTVIYLPGLPGPFIFDDVYNIVNNHYVHLHSIDFDSLVTAAFSTDTGPLKRPVSMLSFALNHYAAGGIDDPFTFKATNVAVHALNGLLVYWLCCLIFARLLAPNSCKNTRLADTRTIHLAASATALLWVVHPIQLTSVLYVVQRMTSLSATFMLLGLIGYLTGRTRIARGERGGLIFMALGTVFGSVLSSLSKETGILLPVFVLLLEATLFRTTTPWSKWSALTINHRRLITVGLAIATLTIAILAVDYAAHGYAQRSFTMTERILTEARVLWMYLSLIIAPGLDRLGLNHDDILISSSLLHPWTTLPSLIGLIVLICMGFFFKNRRPLLALGMLWFFVGHALESTIFSLEIAHEHRNYLPSLGIMLIGTNVIWTMTEQHRRWQPWLILPIVALVLGGVTTLRSGQWSDLYTLATYEVLHHPDSPRAHSYLGQALAQQREYDGAANAYRRAAKLDPTEPAHLMILIQFPPSTGLFPTSDEREEIVRRLAAKRITPSAMLVLHNLNDCVLHQCAHVQTTLEEWARALLKADIPGQDNSLYSHLLGRSLAGQKRLTEALDAFKQSYALDPRYLHPRIDTVKLLLSEGRLREAEHEMSALVSANANSRFRRDRDVAMLAEIFDDLRRRELLPD
jgi:tetratricopeptide (TPR) repeat protein